MNTPILSKKNQHFTTLLLIIAIAFFPLLLLSFSLEKKSIFFKDYLISDSTIITTDTGFFYDDGGPSANYKEDESYVVKICPETPGTYTILEFQEVSIHSSNQDELSVFDGDDTSCPLNKNVTQPDKYTASASSGGCLSIRFRSTSADKVNKAGWKAKISNTTNPPLPCYKEIKSCNGLFTDRGGEEGFYDNNSFEIYTICSGNKKSFIELDFTEVDINFSDILSVYDGKNVNCLLEPNLRTPQKFTASKRLGGCLTITLNSNSSMTGAGWKAAISCTSSEVNPPDACFCSPNPDPANTCAEAPMMRNIEAFCGRSLVTFKANTAGNINDVFKSCGQIHNNSFIQFIASDITAKLRHITTGGTSVLCTDGFQLAVLELESDDCATDNVRWKQLDCTTTDRGLGVDDIFTIHGLIPGKQYYLMIDGSWGNDCIYTLNPISGFDVCLLDINYETVHFLPNGSFTVKIPYKGNGSGTSYEVYEEDNSLNISPNAFTDTGIRDTITLGPYPVGSAYNIKMKGGSNGQECNFSFIGQTDCPVLEVKHDVTCLPNENGSFMVNISYKGEGDQIRYMAYEQSNNSLDIDTAFFTDTGSSNTIELGPYPAGSAYSIKIKSKFSLEKCALEIKGQSICPFCPLDINSDTINYLPNGSFMVNIPYKGNGSQIRYDVYEEDNSLNISPDNFTDASGVVEFGPYLAGSAYTIKIKGESGYQTCDLEFKGQSDCPTLDVSPEVDCLPNGSFMVKIPYQGNGVQIPYMAYEQNNNSLDIDTAFFTDTGSSNTIELGPYPIGSAYSIRIKNTFSFEKCALEIKGQPACPFCPLLVNNETIDCLPNGSFTVTIPYQGNGNQTDYKAYEQDNNSLDMDTICFKDIGSSETIEFGPYPAGSAYSIKIEGGTDHQKCDLAVAGQSGCSVLELNVTADYRCFSDETGYFITGQIEDDVPFPITMECNNHTDVVIAGEDQSFTLGPFLNNAIQIHQLHISNPEKGFSQNMHMDSKKILPEIVGLRTEHATCNTPTGNIYISVGAGQTPYDYAWSNNNNSGNNINLLSGNYNLTVTDANNCRITQNNIEVQEKPILDGASVMPNPSYNHVNLSFDNCGSTIFSFGVYDAITNTRVLEEQTNKNTDEVHMINTSQLRPGVYSIVLRSEEGIKIIRWIKL